MWPCIYEREDWPRLSRDRDALADPLAVLRHRQGRLIGRMEGLGFATRESAVLQTLTEDVPETSRIEGETLVPVSPPTCPPSWLGSTPGAAPCLQPIRS